MSVEEKTSACDCLLYFRKSGFDLFVSFLGKEARRKNIFLVNK